MTPKEARQIADRINKPLIAGFYKKNPMKDIFRQIKENAEKGCYNCGILISEENYNSIVAADFGQKLQDEYGYAVDIEYTEEQKGWIVRISWE
jgi:hypothetical protein